MASWLLDILRWIVTCGEDEPRYDRFLSTPSSSSSSSSCQTPALYLPYSPPKTSPFSSNSPQTQRVAQPPHSSKSSSSSKPSPFPPIPSVRAIESQPSFIDDHDYNSLLKRQYLLKDSLTSSSLLKQGAAVQPQPSVKSSPLTSSSTLKQGAAVQPQPSVKPSPILTSSSTLKQGAAVQPQPSVKPSPPLTPSSTLKQGAAVQPQPSVKSSPPLTSSSTLKQGTAVQPQSSPLTQGAVQPQPSVKLSPLTSSSPLTQGVVQTQPSAKPSLLTSNSPQIWRVVQPLPSAKPAPFSHPSSSSKPLPLKTHDLLKTSLSSPISSSKPLTSSAISVTHASLKQTPSTAPVTPRSRSSSRACEKYEIPKELEEQIKRDIVPNVLRRPLSPSTYADYFAALLYAEDFYIEKWNNFTLSGVTLELKRREAFVTKRENKKTNDEVLMDQIKKPFVAFDIDKIPVRPPYLLSRDFVFVKRAKESSKPFKGILFRVVKSKLVLVDFGDDFHSQYSPSNKYDVSFSFNRVCLKRAHQAVSVANDHSLHDFLFPKRNSNNSNSYPGPHSTVRLILNHKGPEPCLVKGSLSVLRNYVPNSLAELSATGKIIQEAILKIYLEFSNCRILICAPTNKSCDALMWELLTGIPRSELFRANAAFRDYDDVPDDIIPQCLYEGECFTCPSLSELHSFKVISSTYMSSFRLHNAGIDANHFTHIFLVDASSVVEPEVVVPLVNFAGGKSVIVVTGSLGDSPRWVRSDIARKHGLQISYFERLRATMMLCE